MAYRSGQQYSGVKHTRVYHTCVSGHRPPNGVNQDLANLKEIDKSFIT